MSLAQLANEATDSAKHIHPHLVLNMPSVLLATLCAGHLARRTHFLGSKRSGKVAHPAAFWLVSEICPTDNQRREGGSVTEVVTISRADQNGTLTRKPNHFRSPLVGPMTML